MEIVFAPICKMMSGSFIYNAADWEGRNTHTKKHVSSVSGRLV